MFYGLCAAVRWPRSHPGATQPVQDSGAHGPCQNPIAPHLQSINASHSRSPYSLAHTASDSHTPPFHSLSHWLSHPLMFYFNFQILCIPPFFFFNIPLTASSHHFWLYSGRTSTSSSLISHSLAAPFLSFRFFIHIQRKNLSPIISSVRANCVWWQWTGNHKTFLIQTALSHQHSSLQRVAFAKHTLHLWAGFSLTTSQLVPKQLNVYLFQIDSVREKCSARI